MNAVRIVALVAVVAFPLPALAFNTVNRSGVDVCIRTFPPDPYYFEVVKSGQTSQGWYYTQGDKIKLAVAAYTSDSLPPFSRACRDYTASCTVSAHGQQIIQSASSRGDDVTYDFQLSCY